MIVYFKKKKRKYGVINFEIIIMRNFINESFYGLQTNDIIEFIFIDHQIELCMHTINRIDQ